MKKQTKKNAGKKNAPEKKVFRGGEDSLVCSAPNNPSMKIGAKMPPAPPKIHEDGSVDN